jgi:hypothetical protein
MIGNSEVSRQTIKTCLCSGFEYKNCPNLLLAGRPKKYSTAVAKCESLSNLQVLFV